MASKAIQRTFLIVALLATAHLIKPFSLRSVGTHLIHSAASFSFILPNSAASSLEQANYLATVLDNGYRMTEARQRADWTRQGSAWISGTAFASNLLPPQAQSDPVMSFTAISPCRKTAKTVTKTVAQAKPRTVKKLIALNVAQHEEKAVKSASLAGPTLVVNLPNLEIEKIVTSSWPLVKAQLPLLPGVSPSPRTKAANYVWAAPKSCPMEEAKPQPLSHEEIERRMKTSIQRATVQQLISAASSVKLLCVQERSHIRKSITQITVKPS